MTTVARAHDRGTTLLEISVVTSIMAVIALALLSALNSTTTVERAVTDRVEAQENLRLALAAVAADVRVGRPAAEQLGIGSDLAVAVEIADALGSPEVAHWAVIGTGLQRVVIDAATGRVRARDTRFTGLAPTAEATFRYYGSNGTLLDADAMGPTRLAECTSRVRVTLAFDAGTSVREGEVDVAVRTRAPGANAC